MRRGPPIFLAAFLGLVPAVLSQRQCPFCPNGVDDPDRPFPVDDGETCGTTKAYADTLDSTDVFCDLLTDNAEAICCPENTTTATTTTATTTTPPPPKDPCQFCPDGVNDPGTALPTGDGETCGSTKDFADSIESTDPGCDPIKLVEDVCCPASTAATATATATMTMTTETETETTTSMTPPKPKNSCRFCPGGVKDPDHLLPTDDGDTCGSAKDYAALIEATDPSCDPLALVEDVCCPEDRCTFCPGRSIDDDQVLPTMDGETCGSVRAYAHTLNQDDGQCAPLQLVEDVCCPAGSVGNSLQSKSKSKSAKAKSGKGKSNKSKAAGLHYPCSYCPLGVDDPGYALPTDDGETCGSTKIYADSLAVDDDTCESVKASEQLCCPGRTSAHNSTAAHSTKSSKVVPGHHRPLPCSFCPNGVYDPDKLLPTGDDETCGSAKAHADTLNADDALCGGALALAEGVCCPGDASKSNKSDKASKAKATKLFKSKKGKSVKSAGGGGAKAKATKLFKSKKGKSVKSAGAEGSCDFCPGGVHDPDDALPSGDGDTCGSTKAYAAAVPANSHTCETVKLAERLCCPSQCAFCPRGVPDPGRALPTMDGETCGSVQAYAATLQADDVACDPLALVEDVCCPPCPYCPDGVDDPDKLLPTGDGETCGSVKAAVDMMGLDDDMCEPIQLTEDLCCPNSKGRRMSEAMPIVSRGESVRWKDRRISAREGA